MKAVLRSCAIAILALGLVPALMADDAASKSTKTKKDAKASSSKSPASASGTSKDAKAGTASTMPIGSDSLFPATTGPALPPQGASMGASGGGKDMTYRPIPSTAGPLGYFTVDSAYMLPARGWSGVAFVDKRARMPGRASIVSAGVNVGYGFTDWINGFVQWEPYRHIHISNPSQLSLRTPTSNPAFPNATSPTIYRGLLPAPPGNAPGYIEDFPFANRNEGGAGDVGIGVKFRLLSEWKDNPNWMSLAFTNTFFIPTQSGLSDLLDNQVQMGEFNNKFALTASKTAFGDKLMNTLDFGYRITRDPRENRTRMFESADQMTLSQGTILFPQKRLQFMMEHVATIFSGTSTQNTTFGARDPFDGVYGIRWYAWRNTAFDVGYRRTWNLEDHGDKNGFVFKVGSGWWPEKPKPVNRPPTAACSADKQSVVEGAGDSVGIRAMGSDPDSDSLTYAWSATGGSVDGSGPMVRWNPGNARTGTYTVTANVTDGKGGTASCSVDVRVDAKPNRAPSLTCSADRSSVLTGERIRITGTGSDPDGDTLNYTWRTNGGQIVGSGSSVQLDTTGLAPGRYRVTGRAEDPKGAAADCGVDVSVNAPPEKPQASKISECNFRAGTARTDNVCKRVLDDVAVRLQNEPRGRVVIVGYSDPKERNAAKLAQSRADESKKYLVGKGIDASRIDVRSAGGQAGADKANQRVDVIFVPEGATY